MASCTAPFSPCVYTSRIAFGAAKGFEYLLHRLEKHIADENILKALLELVVRILPKKEVFELLVVANAPKFTQLAVLLTRTSVRRFVGFVDSAFLDAYFRNSLFLSPPK